MDSTTLEEEVVKIEEPKELELVDKGRWVQCRSGSFIACRQWRILCGNFRFYLDGRIMMGPGPRLLWLFIIFHLIGTFIVFLVFEIVPKFDKNSIRDYLVPILGFLLSFLAIWNVVQVVLTEPGCVPTPSPEESWDNLVYYRYEKKPNRPVQRTEIVDDVEVQLEFCEPCGHFRPYRSEHCDLCGCCIDRFDHHCKFLGTCVGRRNYGAFIRFILSANLVFFVVGSQSLINLMNIWLETGFGAAIGSSPTLFVLMIFLILPPCGLFQLCHLQLLHSYLLWHDRTHFEHCNRVEYKKLSFASRLRGICELFFCPPPPSKLNPRKIMMIRAITREEYERRLELERSRKKRTVFSCSSSNPGRIQRKCPLRQIRFLVNARNLAAQCTGGVQGFPIPGHSVRRVVPDSGEPVSV